MSQLPYIVISRCDGLFIYGLCILSITIKRREFIMIKKKILDPNRLRRIKGSFSFIPHRFLADGFLATLTQKELLLYLFLVMVSDRHGLSFYSYDAICSFLQLTLDQYLEARSRLIEKDLIAFDGTIFQVLDLPPKPLKVSETKEDPATVRQLVMQSLMEA